MSNKYYLSKKKFVFLILAPVCIYPFGDYLAARIVTPIRCKMWEGKEVKIFLPPDEWQKLSDINIPDEFINNYTL